MGRHHVSQNEHGVDEPSTMERNTGQVRSSFDAARHTPRHAAPGRDDTTRTDVPPRGDGINDLTGW